MQNIHYRQMYRTWLGYFSFTRYLWWQTQNHCNLWRLFHCLDSQWHSSKEFHNLTCLLSSSKSRMSPRKIIKSKFFINCILFVFYFFCVPLFYVSISTRSKMKGYGWYAEFLQKFSLNFSTVFVTKCKTLAPQST